MKILVTGIGGFVAQHLVAELADHGHEVWGTGLFAFNSNDGIDQNRYLQADLTDREAMARVLNTVNPARVIHLAAQSNPAKSWDIPELTFECNVIMTIELVREVAKLSTLPKLIVISSSDVYGTPTHEDLPLSEQSPLRPSNPYSVSKEAAEQSARLYGQRLGVDVIVLRPFSHTGPGQTDQFVVPAFARQIALIESGKADVLAHGDLAAHRDFTDVRDVVRAYRLVAESDMQEGTFNVCSGKSISIQSILDSLCRLSSVPIKTRQDSARVRNDKILEISGNGSALENAVGWKPAITFDKTLRDVLDDQRARVNAL